MGVGLIAPVPRTEDVGVDALITLVRPTEKEGKERKYDLLIPEESFFVQLKTKSTRKVKYEKENAVNWLRNLEIPFFIGCVDMEKASITLYPTHSLSKILLEQASKKYHLNLQNFKKSPKDVRHVNISKPALTWSTSDVGSKDFANHAYQVLKGHIRSMRRNIYFRHLGYYKPVVWEPNEVPIQSEESMIMGSSIEENSDILGSMVAPIQTLITDIIAKKRFRDLAVVMAFIEMMRERGVDPDPGNSLRLLVLAMADGDEISEAEIVLFRSLVKEGSLDLQGTRTTNEALKHIPKSVEQLAIGSTAITDQGLQHLKKLLMLKRLNVSNTSISDIGLNHLHCHENLEWLNVSDTKVTEDGLDELRKIIPSIVIVR